MPWLVGFALAIAVFSPTVEAATLRLLGDWRPGEYAAVEVESAGQGQHELADENIMRVRWSGGGRVVLPVLVYPGDATALTLDGESVPLDQSAAPADENHAVFSPPINVIDPAAYAATAGWRPGRPPAERVTVAALALLFVLLSAVILSQVHKPQRRTAALLLLATTATAAALAWDAYRPLLAIRRADVDVGSGRVDRWFFANCPASAMSSQTLRVTALGETRPVAFSRRHLERTAPTLTCDAAGRPLELSLTLPPGTQAAVVQRLADAAAPDTPPPAWAFPLLRGVYERGGPATVNTILPR